MLLAQLKTPLRACGIGRTHDRGDGIAAPDAIAAPELKLDLLTTYLTAKTTIAPTTTNRMCTERQIRNAWKAKSVRLPIHFPVHGQ